MLFLKKLLIIAVSISKHVDGSGTVAPDSVSKKIIPLVSSIPVVEKVVNKDPSATSYLLTVFSM